MVFSRRMFLKFSGVAATAPLWTRIQSPVTNSATAALCRTLTSDPLRPQYHLLPAHNWMNDPNGPIYFRGRYHMFHQYNPDAAIWGNMHWGHATSSDLIHWQHEPVALAPTANGFDRYGVFSGSAVLDNGKPTVIYTGVAPPASEAEATLRDCVHIWRETQCLAVAQDDALRTWKKLPEPVISSPPAGLTVAGFRDPCIWREDDSWMLILGSGVRRKGGMILLYRSPDLRRWTYLHPLIESSAIGGNSVNPVDTGEMWECPDFFPLIGVAGKNESKHIVLISTMAKVYWKVGTYAKLRFTPETEGVVDWGSYYAAKTMLDADGNRVLWGWIPETRPDADLIAAGWAGVMSLPRVLTLNDNSELQTEVHPAAHMLRAVHTEIHGAGAAAEQALDSLRLHDLAAEVDITVHPRSDQFTLRLQSEAGDFISISCSNISGSRQLRVNNIVAPLSGTPASPVRLHMFLDGSVLELFANNRTALTARIYQIPSGPLRLKLNNVELISLDAWQMNAISKDRLTGSLCS